MKKIMLFCLLLTVVLILSASLVLPSVAARAILADTGEPEHESGVTLATGEPPDIRGMYLVKGDIKIYDWKCNKAPFSLTEAVLVISNQMGHDITSGYLAIPGEEPIEFDKAYVGPAVVEGGKVKNKPRLSAYLVGTSGCIFGLCGSFYIGTINAKVKMDNKTGTPKTIKGEILGWALSGLPFPDNGSMYGQFGGKFTATYVGPPPVASP